MGRQVFRDTHGISGNVFANPTASSSAPYPQESNPWVSNVSEHTSPHVMSDRQPPDTTLDPRFTGSVACREYTLPRDEKSSDPKGWIRGNTKVGPVLEVTTSYLQGKHGVEIRIESMNKDNSHSWVRISHDLNKLVTNLNNNEENDNNEQDL